MHRSADTSWVTLAGSSLHLPTSKVGNNACLVQLGLSEMAQGQPQAGRLLNAQKVRPLSCCVVVTLSPLSLPLSITPKTCWFEASGAFNSHLE